MIWGSKYQQSIFLTPYLSVVADHVRLNFQDAGEHEMFGREHHNNVGHLSDSMQFSIKAVMKAAERVPSRLNRIKEGSGRFLPSSFLTYTNTIRRQQPK